MTILHLKRLLKKIGVTAGLDAFVARRLDAAIILGFHRIDEHDGTFLSQRIATIRPATFEEILSYLRSLEYSFVSLDEIVSCSHRSKKVAITFDDGFRSVYDKAFPILRKFQAPFTVFLTTATLGATRLLWQHRIYAAIDRLAPEDVFRLIGRCSLTPQRSLSLRAAVDAIVRQEHPDRLLLLADEFAREARLAAFDEAQIAARSYLKPAEIVEMMQDGMTVGAHGHNHWSLNTLDRSETEAEIAACADQIKNILGVEAAHYALPFGRSNPHVAPILEGLSFRSLCTTQHGLVRMKTKPYGFPRLMDQADVLGLAGQIILLHLQPYVAA